MPRARYRPVLKQKTRRAAIAVRIRGEGGDGSLQGSTLEVNEAGFALAAVSPSWLHQSLARAKTFITESQPRARRGEVICLF